MPSGETGVCGFLYERVGQSDKAVQRAPAANRTRLSEIDADSSGCASSLFPPPPPPPLPQAFAWLGGGGGGGGGGEEVGEIFIRSAITHTKLLSCFCFHKSGSLKTGKQPFIVISVMR